MPDSNTRHRYTEWRLTHPPIMGGAPDEDGEGDGEADTGDAPANTGTDTGFIGNTAIPAGSTGTTDDAGTAEDGDGDGDEHLRTTVSAQEHQQTVNELNRMRREVAERAKTARNAEREKLAAEGKWKDVADGATSERDAALAERDEFAKRYNDLRAEILVTRVATNLNFRDPSDAIKFLDSDIDLDSDGAAKIIEHQLRQVAKRKTYLVDNQRRSGAPIDGQGRSTDPQQRANSFIASLLGGQSQD